MIKTGRKSNGYELPVNKFRADNTEVIFRIHFRTEILDQSFPSSKWKYTLHQVKETGDLVTQDMVKAEVLSDFFLPQSYQQELQPHSPSPRRGKAGTGRMKNCPVWEKIRFETS